MTEYLGPIIDAHTHLWDLSGDNYPWLRPGGTFGPKGRLDDLKGKNYLLRDYINDINGTQVVASVHVEALWDPKDGQINETRWLDTLGHGKYASRYVAGLNFLSATAVEEIAQQAEHKRVRGIRQVIAWTPNVDRRMVSEPHLTRKPAWKAAISALLQHDLHLELLIYPQQAEDVVELAMANPSLIIVINHMASPIEQDTEGIERWRNAISIMSSQPNIVIKLSAAAAYLEEKTGEAIRPFSEHLINSFGADRVMFGSDFPVGKITGLSYSDYLEQYRKALASRTKDEQAAIFYKSAFDLYRFSTHV